MTALLGRLGERSPVLCILEDLHWADDMSLRLLAFASCRLRDRPVLLTVSARTEDLEESRAFGQVLEELGREPRFEAIELAPLSKDVILSLALALLGGGSRRRHDVGSRSEPAPRARATPSSPFRPCAHCCRWLRPFGAELALPERVRSWCVDASGV